MLTIQFGSPVHIRCSNQSVTTIHSAKEGFDFLLGCQTYDGPLFESAVEACFSALANPDLINDARRGLIAFAHAHGCLAEVERPQIGARKLRVTWRNPTARRAHTAYRVMR